jgi:hypothetical protein
VAPGAFVTYSVTASGLSAGGYTETVTVTATTASGATSTATASATCYIMTTPKMTTKATPTSITLPSSATLTDTATVTGGSSSLAGTVTFALYYSATTAGSCGASWGTCTGSCGASSSTCTGTPIYTQTVTLVVSPAGSGTGTATTTPFTPSGGWKAGTYTWSATFTATDSSDRSIPAQCGGPNEVLTVSQVQPKMTTLSTPTSITLPSSATVTDTATVTGGSSQLAGTVTFALYGPSSGSSWGSGCGGGTCTGTPIYTQTVTLVVSPAGSGTGTATTTPFIPSGGWKAGTYTWSATFTATDSSDKSISTQCGGTGEVLTVSPAKQPKMTTLSTPTSIKLPSTQTVTDTATVTGGSSSLAGTVTFALYGPSSDCSSTCTGTPIYTQTVTLVVSPAGSGTGTATTTPFIPSGGWKAGTYTWSATFTATDSSDKSISTQCGGTGEVLTVSSAR